MVDTKTNHNSSVNTPSAELTGIRENEKATRQQGGLFFKGE